MCRWGTLGEKMFSQTYIIKNDAIEKLQLIKNTTPYSTAWIFAKES